MIQADFKDERLGYVGNVTKINAEPIFTVLNQGYIPVISTIGCDKRGNTFNINGDTAAGKIAPAVNAVRLIMMTDIEGIRKDRDDPSTLIPELTASEAEEMIKSGEIDDGKTVALMYHMEMAGLNV